jgi:hypothetical protein
MSCSTDFKQCHGVLASATRHDVRGRVFEGQCGSSCNHVNALTCLVASAALPLLAPTAAGATGTADPAASSIAMRLSKTCCRQRTTAATAACDVLTSRISSCRAESCTAGPRLPLLLLLAGVSVLDSSRPVRCNAALTPPAAAQPEHHCSDLASCSASRAARICRQPGDVAGWTKELRVFCHHTDGSLMHSAVTSYDAHGTYFRYSWRGFGS